MHRACVLGAYVAQGYLRRFQCHAAERARTGPVLVDLGVHGTDIFDGPARSRSGSRFRITRQYDWSLCGWLQIFLRVLNEFIVASLAAKIICRPVARR